MINFLVVPVPYVLNGLHVWEKYTYFNVFYNVNEFYVFSRNFCILLMKFCECFFVFTPGLM